MTPETTVTIEQVVDSIVKTIAIMTPITALVASSATTFAKNIGMASRWAGLFTYASGFVVGILLGGLVTSSFFGPVTILISIISGFIAAGAYSGIKAIGKTE